MYQIMPGALALPHGKCVYKLELNKQIRNPELSEH